MTMRKAIVSSDLELREVGGVKRLHLTALQEGRVASGLPEVFIPGSLQWGSEGVAVRVGHGAPVEVRAMPVRRPDGRIQLSPRATNKIVQAVKDGIRGASIEFYSMKEKRNRSGVREIQSAFLDGVALVEAPEYSQGRAELRSRRRRIWL